MSINPSHTYCQWSHPQLTNSGETAPPSFAQGPPESIGTWGLAPSFHRLILFQSGGRGRLCIVHKSLSPPLFLTLWRAEALSFIHGLLWWVFKPSLIKTKAKEGSWQLGSYLGLKFRGFRVQISKTPEYLTTGRVSNYFQRLCTL